MNLLHNTLFIVTFAVVLSALAIFSSAFVGSEAKPIIIADQGNFAAGGAVIKSDGVFDGKQLFDPAGQTLHGDHASVFYQIPVNARQLPLIFLHGAGQSANTWGTTPDGREGFQTHFLRKRFAVYLIDQPRRGRAGQSALPEQIKATTQDQMWFNMFRLGKWPDFFGKVQFSKDAEALNQFFRQMTPNTGPYDEQVISDAVADVFERSGPGVLITHSQGGGPGWWTAIKTDKVRGIVSYEPGSGFVFPKGEVPEPMPSGTGPLSATAISLESFKKLTHIPIVIYYGDNIPMKPSDNPGQDNWRVRLKMAQLWVDKINKYGGHASVIHLPDLGIFGNTHFPFSDLNSDQIAELLSKWLDDNNLDRNSFSKASSPLENRHTNSRLHPESTVGELLKHPAFEGFGVQLLPRREDRKRTNLPLTAIGSLMPYHSLVHTADVVGALNFLIDQANRNIPVFYDFYSEKEKHEDPAKADTGLFFFKGKPGAPFAIISPGGGFSYVGSLHEGFPLAQVIAEHGFNVFVLKYRTGQGGKVATEDLAAAVSFLFNHREQFEISTHGYSLWGGSAGARMAAYLGSHGPDAFGGSISTRPSHVVMLYTGHSDYSLNEPATFVAVGENDAIAPPAVMRERVEALKESGTPVEFHIYPDVGHGFGLGTGSSAEGWIEKAIQFWQKNQK